MFGRKEKAPTSDDGPSTRPRAPARGRGPALDVREIALRFGPAVGRPDALEISAHAENTEHKPGPGPDGFGTGPAVGRQSAGAGNAGRFLGSPQTPSKAARRAAERLLLQNQPRVCDRFSYPQVRSPPQTPPKAAGSRAAAPRCLARGRHSDGSGPTARARRATVRRPRPVLMLRKAGPRMPSVIL